MRGPGCFTPERATSPGFHEHDQERPQQLPRHWPRQVCSSKQALAALESRATVTNRSVFSFAQLCSVQATRDEVELASETCDLEY